MAIGSFWVPRNQKNNMKVNFIGNKNIAFFVSGLLFVLAVLSIVTYGFKLGMDFTGGSSLNVSFTSSVPSVTDMRDKVRSLGFEEAMVQTVGTDALLLKTRFLTETEHQQLLADVRAGYENDNNKVLEQSFETIGPAVSQTLKQRTMWAVVLVVLSHVLYIAYAFRKISRPVKSWKYGVVAELAMVHDVIITAGVFAFLGHYFGVEIDIPFIVALLLVFGYSVNDTIVVFDRVRENLIRHSSDDFGGTINNAINETFARSINTTLTTFITLLALFLFGGITIKYFALALLIGVFLGAYSSIFVASPLLVIWHNWKMKKRTA